jgi:hypothetical protein
MMVIKSVITLAPGKLIQPRLMFVGEARNLPREEHLKDAALG